MKAMPAKGSKEELPPEKGLKELLNSQGSRSVLIEIFRYLYRIISRFHTVVHTCLLSDVYSICCTA